MAFKACDYCGVNTSAKPFFTATSVVLLPDNFEKKIHLRACNKCYKAHRLWEYHFRKGYNG